jgi:hypothetical protein
MNHNAQALEMRVPIPGGMALTAKAALEDDYPGIWISLVKPDGTEEPICFAEHNSLKPADKALHIGAYKAFDGEINADDEPVYYESYF